MSKILEINYKRGHLELCLDEFFPCSLKKAKILRGLMLYADAHNHNLVISFLSDLENKYSLLCDHYEKVRDIKQLKRYSVLRKRTQRNIEILDLKK